MQSKERGFKQIQVMSDSFLFWVRLHLKLGEFTFDESLKGNPKLKNE